MKRIFKATVMFAMIVSMLVVASCSTTKSFNKSFEKNGYTMTTLTPQQQSEIAPVMSEIPTFNENAIGYLVTGDAVTFVYAASREAWDNYSASLQSAGYSNMGTGLVKANKSAGITYNISGKFTTVYKQDVLLVTYTYAKF